MTWTFKLRYIGRRLTAFFAQRMVEGESNSGLWGKYMGLYEAASKELKSLAKTADVYDQSWSFHEHGDEERVLFGWWVKEAPWERIKKYCELFAMPAPMVARWLEISNSADGIGIAVNKSLSSLRLYTHHWKSINPEEIGAIVYTGFKMLPDGTVRVDEYRHFGDLRDPENLEYALSYSNKPEWIHAAIESAPENVPLMFAKISNTGRQSWIATVRHADVDAGALLTGRVSGQRLLHIAGGIDASKGSFDTVYIDPGIAGVTTFMQSI